MNTKLSLLILLSLLVACSREIPTHPNSEGKNIEGKNFPVYVWPEGKKYYYVYDEKIYLDEVPNKIVLGFDEKYFSEIQQYLQENIRIRDIKFFRSYVVLTTVENTNLKILMEDLKKLSRAKSVHPVYSLVDFDFFNEERYFTDMICVLFKDNVSQQQIDEIHKKYPVEINKHLYSDFPKSQNLFVPIDADLLGIANAYQESGLVVFSYPFFGSNIIIIVNEP